MTRVLVIQFSRLGDLAQTLPVLRRMRDRLPAVQISVLCAREFADLLHASGLADRVIDLPAARFTHLLQDQDAVDPARIDPGRLHPALEETYDRVVNLSYGAGAGLLCSRIRAAERCGRLAAPPGEIRVAGDWGKYLFATADARRENLFNYVDACIGLAGLDHAPCPGCLPVAPEARARQRRAMAGVDNGPVIGLQLGANKAYRAWPPDAFADLAECLAAAHGAVVVLFGGPGERDLARQVCDRSAAPLVDRVGRTTLVELPAALAACDLIISNDTGPMHIAAAVGTRVLGLYFSAASFTETAPYGAGHVALQVEMGCSPCHDDQVCASVLCRRMLPAEAVAATAAMILGGHRRPETFPWEQVEIYRSGFLDDGTLLYRPVKPQASALYRTALASRGLWAAVLLGRTPAAGSGAPADLAAYEPGLAVLDQAYRAARRSAGAVAEAVGGPSPDRGAIERHLGVLAAVDGQVAALNDPMAVFKAFHRLVLMDMDTTTPVGSGPARRAAYRSYYLDLQTGYARLAGAVAAARKALDSAVSAAAAPSRALRVMVVGAVAGGTVPMGEAAFKAFERIGHPAVWVDFSDCQAELARIKALGDPQATQGFMNACQMRLIRAAEDFRPDVILGMAQSPVARPDVLESWRRSGIALCYWFVEDFRVFDYWRRIAPLFDRFFVIQQEPFTAQLAAIGCRGSHYLPAAFDADVPPPRVAGAPLPLSFVGAPYPNRVTLLRQFHSEDLAIFGEGWQGLGLAAVVGGGRRLSAQEVRAIYLRTRVNLNLHSAAAPDGFGGGDFVNPRTFELAGLGAFQLSDRRDLLPLHFDPQREVPAFACRDDLVRAVDHYLAHDGERRTIARRAQRRVLREHTYEHRMRELIRVVRGQGR